MADVFTVNYRFTLTQYNTPGWDTKVNNNFIAIDAALAQFNIGINLQGLWVNAHAYTAGQSVIDALTGTIWLCGVNHTSIASPGTFAADRAANPTYWSNITNPAATAAVSAAAAAASATTAAASQAAVAANAAAAAASAVTAAASAAAATATSNSLLGVVSGLSRPTCATASTTSVQVAAGARVDSTGTTLLTLAASKTKTTAGAWVTGSAQPGMGVGLVIANNTGYYIFLIMVAGVVDVYFDTSSAAANKPVGTTAFARIGYFRTGGAALINGFVQYGQYFAYATPINVTSAAVGTTAAVTVGLGVTVPAINGISVRCSGYAFDAAANSLLYLSAIDWSDLTPATGSLTCVSQANQFAPFNVDLPVNGLGNIRARVATATNTLNLTVNGWIDPFV